MKHSILLLLLAACSRSPTGVVGLLGEDPSYACTCHDGGAPIVADADLDAPVDALVSVDAPRDAAPPVIDLLTPWTRTVITASTGTTGLYRGADGTAIDSEGCYVTAWEDGGIVTRACLVAGAWVTELVASGMTGPEDAKAGDLDGDGVIDVVTCADAGQRCYITFRGSGSPNVTTTLTASMGHGHAMQSAIADLDGDGLPDIVYGTRNGTTSELGLLHNPGCASPTSCAARNGANWTRTKIGDAGWIMSIVVVGTGTTARLVVSDRAYVVCPAGSTTCTPGDHLWDLNAARWLEQASPGVWANHRISAPAGSCPVGNPMCTTKTPGDEMFLYVDGNTVYDCQSRGSDLDSRIMIHRTTDWLTWTHEVLPPMANVGHCQGVIPADVDHDGRTDLIVTAWKGNAYPVTGAAAGQSGVYGLHATATATGWERIEISGVSGGKFDNAIMDGDCVITSEQLDPAGGLGVVMYCPGATP